MDRNRIEVLEHKPGSARHFPTPRTVGRVRARFAARLLDWFGRHGRDYYWRKPGLSTFELLVVEVLLARTRADAVVPVIDALLRDYPDALSLAQAPAEAVSDHLRPLGLFRKRTRALKVMAEILVERHGGVPPLDYDSLRALPYVGRYAANAFLCFGRGQRRPIVDANVARVFQRYWDLDPAVGKLENAIPYWQLAENMLPDQDVQRFNWALLDLGALVCKPQTPDCPLCPLRLQCETGRAQLKAGERAEAAF